MSALDSAYLFRDSSFFVGVFSGMVATILCLPIIWLARRAIDFARSQKMFNIWQHSGILHIYDTQEQGLSQMYKDALNSKKIYALASLGKTFSHRLSTLYPLLNNRDCDMRFLLLNPASDSAQKRADELNMHGFIDEIKSSLKELSNYSHIKLGLYDEALYFRVYIFENVMYLRFKLGNEYTASTQTWRIGKRSHIYKSIHQQFDDLWAKYANGNADYISASAK